MMILLFRAVTGFLLLKFSVLLLNMAQFPVLRPPGHRRAFPAGSAWPSGAGFGVAAGSHAR